MTPVTVKTSPTLGNAKQSRTAHGTKPSGDKRKAQSQDTNSESEHSTSSDSDGESEVEVIKQPKPKKAQKKKTSTKWLKVDDLEKQIFMTRVQYILLYHFRTCSTYHNSNRAGPAQFCD